MIEKLEYENAMLSSDEMRVASLLDTARSLSNLSVLSLPDCIDIATNQAIAPDLNACLKVRHLATVCLSSHHFNDLDNLTWYRIGHCALAQLPPT